MKVYLVRPIYFAWVIVPVTIYLGYLAFGLPHMIWSYEWRYTRQSQNPYANRYYTRCTFIGPYGAFTIFHPKGGNCGWIKFYKNNGGS